MPAYRSSGSDPEAESDLVHSLCTGTTVRNLKAWDVGQRAIRHFLAARAYFGTFERGPTSVILALDLCDLYLLLASIVLGEGTRAPVAGGGSRGSAGAHGGEVGNNGRTEATAVALQMPLPEGREGGSSTVGAGAVLTAGSSVYPAAVVRYRCLEGALRSVLETRTVFSGAGVDATISEGSKPKASANSKLGCRMEGVTSIPGAWRLRTLLEKVLERLPKVMQALVRASVEIEKSIPSRSEADVGGATVMEKPSGVTTDVETPARTKSSPPTIIEGDSDPVKKGRREANNEISQQPKKRSTVFKSMYRQSLLGMEGVDRKGMGAQAVLFALAAEYAGVSADGYE